MEKSDFLARIENLTKENKENSKEIDSLSEMKRIMKFSLFFKLKQFGKEWRFLPKQRKRKETIPRASKYIFQNRLTNEGRSENLCNPAKTSIFLSNKRKEKIQ